MRWKATGTGSPPSWLLINEDGKVPYFKGHRIEALVIQDLGSEQWFWKINQRGEKKSRSGRAESRDEAQGIVEGHFQAMRDSGDFFGVRPDQKLKYRPFPGREPLGDKETK